MASAKHKRQTSVFEADGFSPTVAERKREIRELYLSDRVPWVVGYSGGKDSTAVLQLIWMAISELDPSDRTKPIHVISTDTLVENPVVAAWVSRSLDRMREAATDQQMPIQPHRLTPTVTDSFWVNLIGRGYPAPRHKFRWCTYRLKIQPSNRFIREVVRENGETILVLGTRKAESSARAHAMAQHETRAVRERLTPNAALHNSLVYTPIEDWTTDDVWAFLMREPNRWGHDNKDLLNMYRGASEDGECPIVMDLNTPSCGNSRFGCWVCTLVDEDKSMAAMIRNDEEKEWMLPLLEIRNELDFRGEKGRKKDRSRRDFRRITGKLTLYVNSEGEPQLVPGPYKQDVRADLLRRVLEAQKWIRDNGPAYVRNIELISMAELQEIRRIWIVDKHEIEDLLPQVYEEATGEPFPAARFDDGLVFSPRALGLLKELAGRDEIRFQLARNLLDVERRYRTMASRRGLYDALEETIEQGFYDSEEDALQRAKERHRAKQRRRDELPRDSETSITEEQEHKAGQGSLFEHAASARGPTPSASNDDG